MDIEHQAEHQAEHQIKHRLPIVLRLRAVLHNANLRELAPAKASSRKVHRPHPELTAPGLLGAQPNGLHMNKDLQAPLTAANARPPPAAIEQEELKVAVHDRLLPFVHHIDIRLLPTGDKATSHHPIISTPSLITNRRKISCTNASSNWTPRGQSFSDALTSAGIAK